MSLGQDGCSYEQGLGTHASTPSTRVCLCAPSWRAQSGNQRANGDWPATRGGGHQCEARRQASERPGNGSGWGRRGHWFLFLFLRPSISDIYRNKAKWPLQRARGFYVSPDARTSSLLGPPGRARRPLPAHSAYPGGAGMRKDHAGGIIFPLCGGPPVTR